MLRFFVEFTDAALYSSDDEFNTMLALELESLKEDILAERQIQIQKVKP